MISEIRSMINYIILFLILSLIGCTPSITIKSEPSEANIFARVPGQTEKVSIGKSPLTFTVKELDSTLRMSPASGDFVEFIIEKDSFQTKSLMVPPSRLLTIETLIAVKLDSGNDQTKMADNLIQYIINSQKFINSKDFERAHIELDKALEVSPKFTKALFLKAQNYFLQGNYQKSLELFERANLLEPGNDDVIKMITHIRENKLNQGGVSVK